MKKIILFTILTFSLVTSGCLKQNQAVEKWEFENNNISNEIKNDEQNITNQTTDKNENLIEQNVFIDNTDGTENWRTYEKKDQNVRIKYHKNWYYDRDEELEKKLGYDLYIGFAESPKILAQGAPYPVEFFVAPNTIKFKVSEHFKTITERDNKIYILTGQKKYKNILDKMAESFEFLYE